MIVMADVGTIPPRRAQRARRLGADGGTLVRFAGRGWPPPSNDEDLLPVRLRLGERALGGALSWTQPQPVSDFPPNGPFADLTPPNEVTVTRQVLAEPTPDMRSAPGPTSATARRWSPARARRKGTSCLFHVTPEATWSNLPISGTFVEMLRRIVQLSRNQGADRRQRRGPARRCRPTA
jgi:hypothetical protein